MDILKILRDWGPLIALAALLVGLQDRTHQRLDRIESKVDRIETKVDSRGERIAHIEGLLAGAKLRPDAPASAGD